jgi:5-hydroxyisourate hydrolase-like protein (transthyretin family)
VIEIAASGSEMWQTLSTQKEGSRLVTRIDDAVLPAGQYLLRARARDRAGNEASTDSRADGQPMLITLPLRSPATFVAGFERTTRRGRTNQLRPTVQVRLGQRVAIAGRLATQDGRAIGGAPVQLLTSTGAAPEQLLETLTTDADGRFRTITTGASTRRLRLAYAGSPVALPTQQTLEMRVPAATSVRVSPRRVRNGRAVTFSGRVQGLPVPTDGKLVEVQVRFTDRWQTFRTTRTDPNGNWSSRYRFQRTRGVQRYRFRIRLPKEGGYPFESSVSRTLHVVVRGR